MLAYIIFGTTGEYSDNREWVVKGFLNKEEANKFEWECKKEANRIEKELDEYNLDYQCDFDELPTCIKVHGLDPNFKIDETTGTDYYTIEVEIKK